MRGCETHSMSLQVGLHHTPLLPTPPCRKKHRSARRAATYTTTVQQSPMLTTTSDMACLYQERFHSSTSPIHITPFWDWTHIQLCTRSTVRLHGRALTNVSIKVYTTYPLDEDRLRWHNTLFQLRISAMIRDVISL